MDIGSTTTNPFAALGLAQEQPARGTRELGQADFLRLMLAQLQNQNPLEPQSNGEFLSQMAQFSTVDGVQQLNSGFGELGERLAGEQTLSAAALLGRDVLIEADTRHSGDGFSGVAALDRPAQRVEIEITDAAGETVRRLSYDAVEAGEVAFAWDGRNAAGEMLPAGAYTVTARAVTGGGTSQIPTLISAPVSAVTRNGANVSLELDGMPPAALSDIRRIA